VKAKTINSVEEDVGRCLWPYGGKRISKPKFKSSHYRQKKKKISKTLLPLRTPWTRLEKDDRLVESGYREICPQMKPVKNTQETPTNQ